MYEFNTFSQADETIEWLKQGKLLVYPTESVWGIGCDAMNEQAVNQILDIKNRPVDKGMIVVTDSAERIEPLLTDLTKNQKEQILHSWKNFQWQQNHKSSTHPLKQATTWLLPLPNTHAMPRWITGEHDSLAIRVIAHPSIQKICQAMVSESNPFGLLISTSCNPATLTPASTLREAQEYFSDAHQVAYLQGKTLGYELPSQIKDIHGTVLR